MRHHYGQFCGGGNIECNGLVESRNVFAVNNITMSDPSKYYAIERFRLTTALKYTEWLRCLSTKGGVKIMNVRSMIFDNLMRADNKTDKDADEKADTIRRIFLCNEDIQNRAATRTREYTDNSKYTVVT